MSVKDQQLDSYFSQIASTDPFSFFNEPRDESFPTLEFENDFLDKTVDKIKSKPQNINTLLSMSQQRGGLGALAMPCLQLASIKRDYNEPIRNR